MISVKLHLGVLQIISVEIAVAKPVIGLFYQL